MWPSRWPRYRIGPPGYDSWTRHGSRTITCFMRFAPTCCGASDALPKPLPHTLPRVSARRTLPSASFSSVSGSPRSSDDAAVATVSGVASHHIGAHGDDRRGRGGRGRIGAGRGRGLAGPPPAWSLAVVLWAHG